MAQETKYISSGKIPFEVKAPTKTTRVFSIKESDITSAQADTICEYINKDSNTKQQCTYENIYDPFLKVKVYYFTFSVVKSRVGLETPLYNAIAIYLDNQTKTAVSAPTPAAQQPSSKTYVLPISRVTIKSYSGTDPLQFYFDVPYYNQKAYDNLYDEISTSTRNIYGWGAVKKNVGNKIQFSFVEDKQASQASLEDDYATIDKILAEYEKANTKATAPQAPNTLKRGQTFTSAAQMQQAVGPPNLNVNSFTLAITGTIINIKGKKPNYVYEFTLPYWDESQSDKLFYGLSGLTNYTRLWSRQVTSNDTIKFTFEEKANTTSADMAQDYKVIDELIRQYLEEYLALKKAPAAPQVAINATLDGIKLPDPYYLMPLTQIQVYKQDVYNIPMYSFYLTGEGKVLTAVAKAKEIIDNTPFGLYPKETLVKEDPDLYKIEFEIVSQKLDDEESTFNFIDNALSKLGYKNPFTNVVQTKSLVERESELFDIDNELDKLKTELDQLVFLRSLNSELDFEKNIELGQKIANVKEKINELNFNKLQAKITTDDIFDQLFEQSFTPLEHEYTNVKVVKGETDDFFTPNGQPTELSAQLNEIIRTQQFKNWFGDWELSYMYKEAGDADTDCSVVLTENFEPKLFYHGTGQAFSYFKFDKFPAAYFAANPDYSKFFANLHGGDEGYVIPFFLNVRNPLDLTLFGTELIKPKEFFDYLYLQTGYDADQLEANPLFYNPTAPPVECWRYLRNNPKMLKKLADNQVYDGIHFYETNPGVPVGLPAHKTEVFITFKADQCKIADNNRGLILLGALKSFLLEKGGKI